jgi:hypothetical protein
MIAGEFMPKSFLTGLKLLLYDEVFFVSVKGLGER